MEQIKDIHKGDLLTFKDVSGKYKVLLCMSTNKNKSPHTFTFCALTIDTIEKPTVAAVKASSFFGVGNSTKTNFYKHSEEEVEKMWAIEPEIKPYFLGCYNFIIWKKDFMKFRDHFEFIGNLKIVTYIDKNGNGAVNASSWVYLKNLVNEKLTEMMSEKDQKIFKLKAILKE